MRQQSLRASGLPFYPFVTTLRIASVTRKVPGELRSCHVIEFVSGRVWLVERDRVVRQDRLRILLCTRPRISAANDSTLHWISGGARSWTSFP